MNKQENILSVKEAIEELKDLNRDVIKNSILKQSLDMAISALTQQLNNGWIPVSKKMPEFDQNCLVTTDSGEIFTSKFFGYGEECQGYREYPEGVWEVNQCGLEVTAWQPLQEPWKEVSE